MTLLKSQNKFIIKITSISENSTVPPKINDFFAYLNIIIYNDDNQGYADCG